MSQSWISARTAATYAALSPETVRRAARAGRLTVVKVNGGPRWRTRYEWVDEWLAAGAMEEKRGESSNGRTR
jgi:excisionase family DNA binding protein